MPASKSSLLAQEDPVERRGRLGHRRGVRVAADDRHDPLVLLDGVVELAAADLRGDAVGRDHEDDAVGGQDARRGSPRTTRRSAGCPRSRPRPRSRARSKAPCSRSTNSLSRREYEMKTAGTPVRQSTDRRRGRGGPCHDGSPDAHRCCGGRVEGAASAGPRRSGAGSPFRGACRRTHTARALAPCQVQRSEVG